MESSPGGLRPRDLGGLISEAFSVYSKNFLMLVLIAAIVLVPLILAYSMLTAMLEIDNGSLEVSGLAGLLPLGIAITLGIFLMYPIMIGALTHGICEHYLSFPVDLGRSYKYAFGKFSNLVLTLWLRVLFLVLMVITCIGIPFAIYFGVKWYFALPTVILEKQGPWAALSRSSELVTGSWWRVFGVILVFLLIIFGIQAIIGLPFTIAAGLSEEAAEIVLETIGALVTTVLVAPFAAIITTIIYYDLRLRKEEFNIAIMADELGYRPVGGSMGQDVPSPWSQQTNEGSGYSNYGSGYSSQQDSTDYGHTDYDSEQQDKDKI